MARLPAVLGTSLSAMALSSAPATFCTAFMAPRIRKLILHGR